MAGPSRSTLAYMRWTLLLLLVVGCAGMNESIRQQEEDARLSQRGPPTCTVQRQGDESATITCEQPANERMKPDFPLMLAMELQSAANAALSVGRPYLQLMGTRGGEFLDIDVAVPVDCTSVRIGVVTNTGCTGGGTVSRAAGWRDRVSYQFLTAEVAQQRLRADVPAELRPFEALSTKLFADDKIAQLTGRPVPRSTTTAALPPPAAPPLRSPAAPSAP